MASALSYLQYLIRQRHVSDVLAIAPPPGTRLPPQPSMRLT
ncbi:MAG: hypothetical protein R2861_04195 [Desulfobacterales bacterium]